jgi:hypothetical protein
MVGISFQDMVAGDLRVIFQAFEVERAQRTPFAAAPLCSRLRRVVHAGINLLRVNFPATSNRIMPRRAGCGARQLTE